MKTSLPLLIVAFAALPVCTLFGQVPGAGFEVWNGSEPEGWATSNAPPVYANVSQSADAHTGSSSVKGEAINFYSVVLGATVQSGADAKGFAYTGRPAAVTGWYKFFPQGGDRFGVNVALYKGGVDGTPVALAASADSTHRDSYTQFTVPFTYFNSEVPDVCVMQFSTAYASELTKVHAGTYFLLDDVDLTGVNGIPAGGSTPAVFELSQNFPNPFNPTTTISFQLPAAGSARLAVYDLLGREMAVLAQGTMSAGRHEIRFDASRLSSGIYFCRLESGTFVAVRKMTLSR
jgi:hypothetical protein